MTTTAISMGSEGPPEVTLDGEHATLTFRRDFPHPPDRVWKAITEPEELRVWCLTDARIVGRKGGTVDLVSGEGRVHVTGRVLEWDPPRLYEYESNIAPDPRFPKGESSVVRWELTSTEVGTRVVLTHRRVNPVTARRAVFGIGRVLDRLISHLDGTPLPDMRPGTDGASRPDPVPRS